MKEQNKIDLKRQAIQMITKKEISIGRYKKVIKDINEIQLIDILDGCDDEKFMEILQQYYATEYTELQHIYSKLQELKHKKEHFKATCDAINKLKPHLELL